MLNNSRLFHPRLMRELHTHHNARGYIQHKTIVQDAGSGEETIGYVTDPLLIGIAAQIESAARGVSGGGSEIRRPDSTIVQFAYTIALQGYYPQIIVTDRFVIGNDLHDILDVAHDSEHAHTTLTTEIVSHGP